MADANREVQIRLTAKDETKAAFESANGSVKQTQTSWKGMALAVATGQAAFNLAAGAVKSMAGFLEDCTKQALDNSRAQAAVDQIVKNSGVDFKAATEAIGKQADAFVKLGFAGTDTQESMSRLLAITKDTEKSTKLMALAADIARAKNMDLASATDAVQRMLLNGGAAAKKLGVDIDASATSTQALDAAMKQFGGTASAFAKSTAGSVQVASTAWAELKEQLGGQFLKVVNEVYGALGRLAADERVKSYLLALTGFISDKLVVAVEWLIKTFESFTNGTSPAVATALGYLTRTYEALKGIVVGVWEWIGKIIDQLEKTGIIDHFRERWQELANLYETELRPAVDRLFKALEPYQPLLRKIAEVLGGALVLAIIAALELLTNFIEAWVKLSTAIVDIGTAIANFFKPAIDTVASAISGVLGLIDRMTSGFVAAANAARSAANAARSFVTGGGNENKQSSFASGGIVTSPTYALIGESGPEAVVPLGSSMGASAGASINVMQGATVVVGGQADERRLARTIASEIARTLQGQRQGLATQL